MTNDLEKEAQQRSIWKTVTRGLNPIEQAKYWGFRDYRKIYDAISRVDEKMRNKVEGQNPNLKNAIHEARIAFKKREFAKVVYFAMKVLDSINGVFETVGELDDIRRKMLKEYSGSKHGLREKQLRELHEGLGKKARAHVDALLYTSAAPDFGSFTKEMIVSYAANPGRWLKENIPSFRGMHFDIVDKMFRNQADKQREAARYALQIAEDAFRDIKGIFGRLEDNLSNFEDYIDIAVEARHSMAVHRNELAKIYQNTFSHILPSIEEAAKAPVIKAPIEPAAPVEPVNPAASEVAPATNVQPEQQAPEAAVAPPSQTITPPKDKNEEGDLNDPSKAASFVLNLISRAKQADEQGQRGVAVALLVKASEICDQHNDAQRSITLLKAAQELIGE